MCGQHQLCSTPTVRKEMGQSRGETKKGTSKAGKESKRIASRCFIQLVNVELRNDKRQLLSGQLYFYLGP